MKIVKIRKWLVVAAILLGSLLPWYTDSASATVGKQNKITLCHATASTSNPYVQITVAYPSVAFQGHDGHSDDIIPPLYGYPGKNWTVANQVIFNNDCETPCTSPTTAPSTTTTLPVVTTTTVQSSTTTSVNPSTTTIPVETTTTTVLNSTSTIPAVTTTVSPSTTSTSTTQLESTTTTMTPTTTAPLTSTTSLLKATTTTTSTLPSSTTSIDAPTTSTTSVPTEPIELAKTGIDVVMLSLIGASLALSGSLLLIAVFASKGAK